MTIKRHSGLWNFSVRVQSWSDEIESDPFLNWKIFENHQSDPVLIRKFKIMYFCFASLGKRITGAVLPLAKYNWLKAKLFQRCFCLLRQNRHSILAFLKFNNELSIWHQRDSTAWGYFVIKIIPMLGLVKWQGRHT